MQPDVLSYYRFYASPLGLAAAQLINRQIDRFWTRVDGLSMAGLGYAVPYLDPALERGAEAFALMPARQGVFHWPGHAANRATLVEPINLPFADSSLDRLLVIHALEHTGRPEQLLREAWRILRPSGEVILAVPNRRRIWSAVDKTPFGHGRPFSKTQLAVMMQDHMLPPSDWTTVLMTPPFSNRLGARMLLTLERPVRTIGRHVLGGVLMVRASKQMYGLLPKMKKQPARRAIPVGGLVQGQALTRFR